ncbi:MAG: ferredoxin [Acidimicrobiales bacterium]|jgi:ferredoxin
MATESDGVHEPWGMNESAITVPGDSAGRATIDRDACMGSGNCSFWAPGVFDLDDDGIAVVIGDLTGHEEQVRQAAENCPTSAIVVDGI